MWRDYGRQQQMGLGSLAAVSLSRARELAADARKAVAEGADPIATRKAENGKGTTFADAAKTFHVKHASSQKNQRDVKQWLPMIERYCAPIWKRPVASVTRADDPIWLTKMETADRVRMLIETVIESATADGLIPEDRMNPAAKTGRLIKKLDKRPRVRVRQHHPAMPFQKVPALAAQSNSYLPERTDQKTQCMQRA